MKTTQISIIAVLFSVIFTSCYTRKQCGKFCITDTITVKVVDTLRTETIKHDTVIKYDFDTVYISKDKLQIKLIRVKDSILVKGACIGDTIYYTKVVKVPYKLPEQTTLQKIKAVKYYIVWIFFIGVALGLFMQVRR